LGIEKYWTKFYWARKSNESSIRTKSTGSWRIFMSHFYLNYVYCCHRTRRIFLHSCQGVTKVERKINIFRNFISATFGSWNFDMYEFHAKGILSDQFSCFLPESYWYYIGSGVGCHGAFKFFLKKVFNRKKKYFSDLHQTKNLHIFFSKFHPPRVTHEYYGRWHHVLLNRFKSTVLWVDYS